MINVTFHGHKKLSSLFTVMDVVVAASLSNFIDVSSKMKFFSVSVYKFSIHFPVER